MNLYPLPLHFADEAPKPKREETRLWSVATAPTTTPAVSTCSPLGYRPALAYPWYPGLASWNCGLARLGSSTYLRNHGWAGAPAAGVVYCLPFCFGACGWELTVHRGSEGFTVLDTVSSRGLATVTLPGSRPQSSYPSHSCGQVKLLGMGGAGHEPGTVTESVVLCPLNTVH